MSSSSEQVETNLSSASHGTYVFSRVVPQGPNSAALQNGSVSEILLEIPEKVMNLSKSFLNFNLEVPATAARSNSIHNYGMPLIQQLSLYARDGTFLYDMSYQDMVSRVLAGPCNSLHKLLSTERNQSGVATLGEAYNRRGWSFQRSNAKAVSSKQTIPDNGLFVPFTPLVKSIPLGVSSLDNGYRLVNGVNNVKPAPGNTDIQIGAQDEDYTEPNYILNSASGAALNIQYSIPLSSIHQSILALNKTLYFGQSLVLRIRFNSLDRIGFSSVTGTSSVIQAAGSVANAPVFFDISSLKCNLTTDAATATIAAATITNIELQLAVETNSLVVHPYVNKVKSEGFVMAIPYLYCFLQTLGAGGASQLSAQVRLNSGFGKKLQYIMTGIYQSDATKEKAFDVSNLPTDIFTANKVLTVQSNIDQNPLQINGVLNVSQGQNYYQMKDLLEGSVIQSRNILDHNNVWIDSFREGRTKDWDELNNSLIDGTDLSSERIYTVMCDIQATANGYRVYQICGVQRLMTILPSGQIIVQ